MWRWGEFLRIEFLLRRWACFLNLICQTQQESTFSTLSKIYYKATTLFSVKLGISNLRKWLGNEQKREACEHTLWNSSLELLDTLSKVCQNFRNNNRQTMEREHETVHYQQNGMVCVFALFHFIMLHQAEPSSLTQVWGGKEKVLAESTPSHLVNHFMWRVELLLSQVLSAMGGSHAQEPGCHSSDPSSTTYCVAPDKLFASL